MTVPLLPVLLALWAVVLFESLVILGLVRTLREVQNAVESGRLPQRLPVGASSPRFTGTDLRTGAEIDSSDLIARETVILFLSHGCPDCRRLADGTRQVPVDPGQTRIAVCHSGPREASAFADVLAADFVVLADPDGTVFSAFGITATPAAVVVDRTGRVGGSGGPRHSGELASLVSTARDPAVGDDQPLPAIT
jgi:peroxiredoxin